MSGFSYKQDRAFTDKIHKIAENIIYPKINLTLITNRNTELANIKDCSKGIDYEAINSKGKIVSIQERFREEGGNDFTIRYRRDENEDDIEKLSEYYKIKSELRKNPEKDFYFLYGIVNDTETNFIKFAVINLNKLFENISNNKIKISDDESKRISYIKDDILYAAVNYNTDKSSSFIVFDVGLLSDKFNDIVVYQEGFIIPNQERPSYLATLSQLSFINKLAKDNGLFLSDYNKNEISKIEAQILIDFLKSDKVKNTDIKEMIKNKDAIKTIAKYLK